MPLGPNESLIGSPDARRRLATPALLVDLDVFERNIARMARFCREAGRALRPHVKGPKCVAVARRQIETGAIGVSCATLFEAETMADGGISDLLLTSPVVTPGAINRLMALNQRSERLIAAVDNPQVLAAFDAAAGQAGKPLAVVVDYDVGQQRTGAATEDAAVALAGRAARARHLEFRGVQAYYGHLQAKISFDERRAAALAQIERLSALIERLQREGLAPEIVSGGGTGTCAIDLEAGVFTELQPGSYPFMDAQYERVEIARDELQPFGVSLFVQATVVSANQPGQVTINAGMKAIPTDGAPPRFTIGARADGRYTIGGDEFGFVHYGSSGDANLTVGDVVECVTPHCDTTTNLHAFLHCVRGDELVDIWPIEPRGRW